MRKIVAATTAVLVVAAAAVAYAQQVNTYTVTGATSPAKAGSKKKPVPVGIKFNYTVGEKSGNRPSPVSKYSIRFNGLRVNTQAFPHCSASKLEAGGVGACPAKSIVGTGFIKNATGAKDNPADRSIECNGKVTVINGAGPNRGLLYVEGSPQSTDPRTRCAIELAAPIETKYVKRGKAVALEFSVPSSLLHPLPTLDNAVTSVQSSIKRVRGKGGRGYYEAIGGCKKGRRALSVVFTAENGVATTAASTAKC